MLIETASTFAAPSTTVAQPAPAAHPQGARDGLEIAAHDARNARIERALGALDDLARTRRTHELVEAIERLGAGLGSTMDALDDALGTVAQAQRLALEAPAAWEPISAPLVPITAFVAAPATELAPVQAPTPLPAVVPSAPRQVAVVPAAPRPAAAAPVAPTPVAAPAAPQRQRLQAPDGLAGFVIDFPQIRG